MRESFDLDAKEFIAQTRLDYEWRRMSYGEITEVEYQQKVDDLKDLWKHTIVFNLTGE